MLLATRAPILAIHDKHRAVQGCACKIIFYPQNIWRPVSNQSCSVANITSVVDIVGPLSITWGCRLCTVFVSLLFCSLWLFLSLSGFSLCFHMLTHFFFFFLLSPLLHTHSASRFVPIQLPLTPMSHFHYKTEWIWATAWITSPHLTFIRFPEGSHGFYILSPLL